MFSEFHARSFWSVFAQILKQNKYLYRTYIECLAFLYMIKPKKKIEKHDEDYFES